MVAPRLQRAQAALDAYRSNEPHARAKAPDASPDDVIDLLTDLRHLCAAQGWDVTEAWAWSDLHFRQEQGR